jgi:hypothetical protein
MMTAHSGEQIALAARVEALRRLVAAGRYRVEPYRLAVRILARALGVGCATPLQPLFGCQQQRPLHGTKRRQRHQGGARE